MMAFLSGMHISNAESRRSKNWPMARTKSPNIAGIRKDVVAHGQLSPQDMLF
jgi:hypothetical protein